MISSFFWMCSGADPALLQQCPRSERIKYAGIGATIFFTALMAFIAGSYALFTVFDSVWIALPFGLIWGLLIFNLDRFIVSSMKKQDDRMAEFGQVIPRVVLACIIAVVIAKPLEMKIFEKEIERVMRSDQLAMQLDDRNEVSAIYASEQTRIAGEISKLKGEVAAKQAEVDALYTTYIAEAEGRDGTMLLGKGPVYAEKREKHDTALAELASLSESNQLKINALETDMASIRDEQKKAISEGEPIIANYDGLLARLEAMGKLPLLPSLFIFLLFLAIETAPIFTKLLSPKGEYDIRLAEAEHKVSVWSQQKTHQRIALLQADKSLNKKVYGSIAEEEETYHYKKQLARGLIRWQSEAFVEEQKGLVPD